MILCKWNGVLKFLISWFFKWIFIEFLNEKIETFLSQIRSKFLISKKFQNPIPWFFKPIRFYSWYLIPFLHASSNQRPISIKNWSDLSHFKTDFAYEWISLSDEHFQRFNNKRNYFFFSFFNSITSACCVHQPTQQQSRQQQICCDSPRKLSSSTFHDRSYENWAFLAFKRRLQFFFDRRWAMTQWALLIWQQKRFNHIKKSSNCAIRSFKYLL